MSCLGFLDRLIHPKPRSNQTSCPPCHYDFPSPKRSCQKTGESSVYARSASSAVAKAKAHTTNVYAALKQSTRVCAKPDCVRGKLRGTKNMILSLGSATTCVCGISAVYTLVCRSTNPLANSLAFAVLQGRTDKGAT